MGGNTFQKRRNVCACFSISDAFPEKPAWMAQNPPVIAAGAASALIRNEAHTQVVKGKGNGTARRDV